MSSSSTSSITTEEGDAVHMNLFLLPGFRFYPTEEVLVSYYLRNKIQGTDSRFRHVIPEIDICKHEPCEIPAFFPKVPEKEWFFFSRPDCKYNPTRVKRATDQGFYKPTGKERVIKAEESKAVIGKKRTLTFYEGRVPKAKKTDWVVHEYYLTETEVGSEPTKQMDFVLCRLKNKCAGYKKPRVDPIRGELVNSGANSEDDRDAVSDVIAEPVEHLGSKELGDVNSSESPDGSCLVDCNEILTFDDGDDETDGWKFSDFDDPAESDIFRELYAEMEEILNSSSQPPQPPQTPQPHQPPQQHQPHQPSQPHQPPQDYCPSTLQPPLHTMQGNVPYVYGDCTKQQSLLPDNISYHEYKNNISTNDPSGVQDQASDERYSEAFFSPEEFMGPSFDPSWPQDYLPLSPMNTEVGNVVHANNYIGCNDELQSLDDMEIETVFP